MSLSDTLASFDGVDQWGNSPLMQALQTRDFATAAKYIQQDKWISQPNNFEETPLHWAVVQGQLSLAQKLLEKGADPNAADCRGKTPVWDAIYVGNASILKDLLQYNGRLDIPNSCGMTPFGFASFHQDKKLLDVLDKYGYPNGYSKKVASYGYCQLSADYQMLHE